MNKALLALAKPYFLAPKQHCLFHKVVDLASGGLCVDTIKMQ